MLIECKAMLVCWDTTWHLLVAGVDKGELSEGPTSVLAPRLDDFGPTLTCVLHCLGHAFPCHLVGVISGAHCDLVLYRRQQCQV